MNNNLNTSKTNQQKLNGLLLIDKPIGLTSHDVVGKVRKILGMTEVGHSGTLDPLASGLMVLLVGEATKLSQYVTDGDKSYIVQLQTGLTTDTLDSTGAITQKFETSLSFDQVKKTGEELSGDLTLAIPLYSAKKIDGKKMYEYARENEPVVQPSKVMRFWDVKIEKEMKTEIFDDLNKGFQNFEGRRFPSLKTAPNSTLSSMVESTVEPVPKLEFPVDASQQFVFSMSCSKGSFIRAWVSELGARLNSGASMTGLRRVRSSEFTIERAQTLESLALLFANGGVQDRLIPLTEALGAIKQVKVRDQDLNLLKNGQISQGLRTSLIRVFDPDHDQVVQVMSDKPERLVALIGLSLEKGFVIRRVFN